MNAELISIELNSFNLKHLIYFQSCTFSNERVKKLFISLSKAHEVSLAFPPTWDGIVKFLCCNIFENSSLYVADRRRQ